MIVTDIGRPYRYHLSHPSFSTVIIDKWKSWCWCVNRIDSKPDKQIKAKPFQKVKTDKFCK